MALACRKAERESRREADLIRGVGPRLEEISPVLRANRTCILFCAIEQQGTSACNGGLAGCEELGLNLLLNRRGIRPHGCESQKNINEYVLAIGRLETWKFYVIG